MLEDRQGRLWFGTARGVSRYDGTGFTTPEAMRDWSVWSMAEDRQGRLWFVARQGKGVMRYDGARFTRDATIDDLGRDQLWSVHADRQGRLWFGTRGDGVRRYDGETWTRFTTEDGLAGDWICLLYTSPSPRDVEESRMPSSA